MNILHYDLINYDIDDIMEITRYLNSKGLEVVAIPKDLDLLLDCDTFTLNLIKQKNRRSNKKERNYKQYLRGKFDFPLIF